MRFYHRTTQEAARIILARGFKDGHGDYGFDVPLLGLFLSAEPVGAQEGARGDALLEVTLELTDAEVEFHEIIEEGKPFREWIFPADLINGQGVVCLMSREEEDAIHDDSFESSEAAFIS
jgi:hypothetical protein